MLSKRITANNLELKPAIHARARTKKTSRLFQPPGFVNADLMSPFPPASAMLVCAVFSHVFGVNQSTLFIIGHVDLFLCQKRQLDFSFHYSRMAAPKYGDAIPS